MSTPPLSAPSHRVVRLFPDHARDWPLWESPLTAPRGEPCTTPSTYRLGEHLTGQIARWNSTWEGRFAWETGWDDAEVAARWAADGEALAAALAAELSGTADVSYQPWPVSDVRIYRSGDLDVRPCAQDDVAALAADEPPGADIAVRLFARQQGGESVFLVARGEPGGPATRQRSRRTGAMSTTSGGVVGWGELLLGPEPELRHLQVAPGSRGRGVGSAVVRAAEHTRGITRLSIGVAVDNPAARRLYERLGYVGTGELTTTTYTYVDATGEHEATETDERLVRSLSSHLDRAAERTDPH